ncbi:TetR/AcrR family transcriptional regulator [Corynebacterium amycolatum]|uniref:TetR/AcrR family transcriptional regulator n=1 Tax=Corynebacterium amycolatum TaxID=43765 RepID=UPI000E154661|nr:TetR/AcrR family transcriptional regulator [Corynebacterium amycolatum]STB95194.1 TetR family transcriptional regulator [Corynebacterium amycolatum]
MPRTPKQDRSKETHRKLVEATVHTLATRGVPATTVSLVAEKAGVSRGAAQHHFQTREMLIEQALGQISAERTEQFREAIAALDVGENGAPVEEVIRLVIDFFTGELFHAATHVWSAAASEPNLAKIILPAESRLNREIYELTAEALKADLSDKPTRRFLTMLFDVARGLGLSSVLVDATEQKERAVEALSLVLGQIKRLD